MRQELTIVWILGGTDCEDLALGTDYEDLALELVRVHD